ncbi:RNA polymerase sigma factor [Gemmatimonadota bacterium]
MIYWTKMENRADSTRDSEESLLVEGLKRGDPAAADELFKRYSRPLHAFIMRMTGERHTAEDIFQDTWVRIVRNIDSFRGDCKFSSWMFQIALNLCRNLARGQSRREFVELDKAGVLAQDPDVDADRILLAVKMKKLVASLPDKMREVVVLRFYHEKTDFEIAEITGLPAGTVKSRIFRGMKLLKDKIESTGLAPMAEEVG